MKVKKLILTVAGIFVAGGLALSACSDNVEQTDSVAKTGTQKTEAKKEVKPEDKVYKIGDTVSINGLEVTVKSAQFTNPAEYVPAEKGKVLTVEVQAVNKSGQQVMFYDGDFNISDSKGNQYQEYFGYDWTPVSADLNKGKSVTGKIAYDVAPDGHYELIYTTWLGTEIKWDIVPQ
jgi:hypothetical protein